MHREKASASNAAPARGKRIGLLAWDFHIAGHRIDEAGPALGTDRPRIDRHKADIVLAVLRSQSQAATVLTIPDHAQGAAIDGGGLWIARSDWSWGTLNRLDPEAGTPQRRYEIAPGTEGIAFGSDARRTRSPISYASARRWSGRIRRWGASI